MARDSDGGINLWTLTYERKKVYKQLLKEYTREFIEMGYDREWAEDQAYLMVDDEMVDQRFHQCWDI